MARAATTPPTSRLRRLLHAPFQAGGLALFVAASFGGTAISNFIDCSDAFWAVACGHEVQAPAPATGAPGDEVLGISIVLQNGAVCSGMDTDVVTCRR